MKRLHAGAFLFVLLALALTAGAYHIGLSGPFLLDDRVNLTETEIGALNTTDLGQQLFAKSWPYPGSRGLTRVSFALTRFLSGDHARAFKYQNLMLHLINGLLVFWLLLLLMQQRPPLRDGLDPTWLAAMVTAIWLLHPLQVSTVLYAVQRLVILATLFMLAALIAYTKGRLLAGTRPLAGLVVAATGVTMFTAFGLLSKENAVLTPLLIVVVEVFVFQFQFAPTGQPKGRLTAASFFALFAVPISIGVFYALLHFDSFVGGYRGRGFTLEQRLMTELHVLVLYLKLILAPLPASMSLFHDDFPITQKLDLGIALLAAGFAAAAILAAGLRNRAPWIGFGILWFFACHLLESTFIPLELVFEHRNYLGLLGPTIVVVVLIGAALRAAATRRLAFPVLSALALLLAFNTHARALVWSNMELLLVSDYKQRPTSGRVLSGLATLKFKQGERDQAFQYLHELQALSDVEAAPFLGEIELQCEQPAVDPELFNKAQQRLESGPVTVFASNSLRNLSNRALKDKCLALTADQLGLLLQTAADNSRFGPGVACQIYEMNARFNIEQRQHAAALDHLQRAIRSCGGPGDVRYRKLIEVVLVFAADRGHLSWTLDLLSKAAKTPDKRDITDYFPDWISAEMIRPEKIAQLRAEGQ